MPALFTQGPLVHPLCRLGLATRGGTSLTAEDVMHAVDRRVNFLNWCGHVDGLSEAVGQLGTRRAQLALCVQFDARGADDARRELEQILGTLKTDYVDVLTFYYVEHDWEWRHIIGPGGALQFCQTAKEQRLIRHIGLTTHQRKLAAKVVRSGLLDTIMIRYNAAHRGAEQDIFPLTLERGMPVIVYTCLRWGALLRPTPADPAGFQVPTAPAWYRFALHHPAVCVALAAPDNRRELDEDLSLLDDVRELSAAEYASLTAHGQRVREHAGRFP